METGPTVLLKGEIENTGFKSQGKREKGCYVPKKSSVGCETAEG